MQGWGPRGPAQDDESTHGGPPQKVTEVTQKEDRVDIRGREKPNYTGL